MTRKLQIWMIAAALVFLGWNSSAQEPTREKTTTTIHKQSDTTRGKYNDETMDNAKKTSRHQSDSTRIRKSSKRSMKHDTTGTYQAPDNTGRNKRDRDKSRLTPTDQSNKSEDIEITRKIRREITSQKGMSVNARNIKIITVDGNVTLRGPVKTEEEKQQIGAIAEKIAQSGKVDNQLEVK